MTEEKTSRGECLVHPPPSVSETTLKHASECSFYTPDKRRAFVWTVSEYLDTGTASQSVTLPLPTPYQSTPPTYLLRPLRTVKAGYTSLTSPHVCRRSAKYHDCSITATACSAPSSTESTA